jgi:hypothetical protein
MAQRIAFATFEGFPDLTDDDRLAVGALAELGVRVDPVIWRDPDVDWSTFDAVVIRSCWDYHQRPNEFRAWLEELKEKNIQVWNPHEVSIWNMQKTYLGELQAKRVPVLESVWVTEGDFVDLKDLMRQNSWSKAVIKPMISAAAHNTEVFSIDTAERLQEKFDGLRDNGGVIVQQFADEITIGGEWSLMFFNKKYSHAVIKRPQNGDFRVQRDFGGTAHSIEAPLHLIDQARDVLDLVDSQLLYARVDGIERDRKLYLMELELIEPHLFFEQSRLSAQQFASALIELSRSVAQ